MEGSHFEVQGRREPDAHTMWLSLTSKNGEIVGDPLTFATLDEAVVFARGQISWQPDHRFRVVRVDYTSRYTREFIPVWPVKERTA